MSSIDSLERDIMNACRSCVDENEDVLLDKAQSAGKRAVMLLKERSKQRTGRYKKGWRSSAETSATGVEVTVYNKTDYQLTHLLENPHAISNQTHRTFGHTQGDQVIAGVAREVSAEFMQGGDGQ